LEIHEPIKAEKPLKVCLKNKIDDLARHEPPDEIQFPQKSCLKNAMEHVEHLKKTKFIVEKIVSN
jgi:hypothetical protein